MAFLCSILLLLVPLQIFSFSYNVRVLLDETTDSVHKVWRLQSANGFYCSGVGKPHTKTMLDTDTLEIVLKNNNLYCNSRRCSAQHLKIEPKTLETVFEEYRYNGIFYVIHKHEKVYLINQLDLEEYLFAVLRWESWPGWPIEVNKAFAIACRSYVISRILQAEKRKRPFHIRRTNIHQTYKGLHTLDYLRQAIDQTRGIILTHDNKPIDAMFDVCCGGVIPSLMHGVNFEKAPYLARSYPCTFCKPCKSYSYTHQFSLEQLEPLILKQVPEIKKLKELKVIEKDTAGVVQKIMVVGSGGSSVLTGKQFYSFIEKIKSFCFSIYKKGQQFFINGKGFGHHLGMCQWGARAMVEQGRTYVHILQFYYPGAVFKQLYAKKESV